MFSIFLFCMLDSKAMKDLRDIFPIQKYISLEVLDLDFDKQSCVNEKSKTKILMICLWISLWIEET